MLLKHGHAKHLEAAVTVRYQLRDCITFRQTHHSLCVIIPVVPIGCLCCCGKDKKKTLGNINIKIPFMLHSFVCNLITHH